MESRFKALAVTTLVAGVSIVLLLALTIALAPNAGAQVEPRGKGCGDFTASEHDTFEIDNHRYGMAGGSAYTFCLYKHRRDRAKPHVFAATFFSAEAGEPMNCLFIEGIWVNFIAYDQRGHRVNPGKVWIPCQSGQESVERKVFPHRKRWLKLYNSGAPRWEANYEIVISLHTNRHGHLESAMLPLPDIWPFRQLR